MLATVPVSPIILGASAPAGTYNVGSKVTLTLYSSEAVTVSGTPTLTLNDGGTATYSGGSGTNALTFSYTVAAGQSTSALAATAINGTIADLDGNALNTSNLSATFAGVAIATTPPTQAAITAISESPASGDLNAGKTVTLTLTMNEAVTVKRHAYADAQRRRHRDLYRRFGHRTADLQHHSRGRPERLGLGDHRGQSAERR